MSSMTTYRRIAIACVACISFPTLAADHDQDFSAHWSGKIHLDFARFGNDAVGTPNRDHQEIRRAGFNVSGNVHAFDYKFEVDVTDLDDLRMCDAFISRTFGAGTLTVGQFEQPFTLEDRTGSTHGTFLEGSFGPTALSQSHRLGVGWHASPGDMTWAATAYSLETIDNHQTKGGGVGGRATWAPVAEEDAFLHLGVSAALERAEHAGAEGAPVVRVRPRLAGHLSDMSRPTLVDFSNGRDTDVDKWALEYAQGRGPLSWQAEYSGARYDDGVQRADVRAWYGAVSWFVTGESRLYSGDDGHFRGISPAHHRAGAFELALRYDTLRADQHGGPKPVRDGRVDAWTLGATWYVRPKLRLMLNYIQGRTHDEVFDATVDHTRALTGRLQYHF